MKKLICLLLLLMFFCIISLASYAQENGNIIKINPLSIVLRTANFSFEKITGAQSSFQFGAFYSNVGGELNGIGLTPEYRYYTREAGSGFYLAPYVRYWNFWESDSNTSLLSLGVNMGTQLPVGGGFRVDFFFGPQYFHLLSTASPSGPSGYYPEFMRGGFGLRGGVNLGFGF